MCSFKAAVCVDYDRPLLQGRTQNCLDHFWVSCCLCINNTPSLINQLMHFLRFRLVSSPTSNKPTCRNPCNASQKSPDDDSFGMDMVLSWVVSSFPCTFSDRWPHESESSCLSACQRIVAPRVLQRTLKLASITDSRLLFISLDDETTGRCYKVVEGSSV